MKIRTDFTTALGIEPKKQTDKETAESKTPIFENFAKKVNDIQRTNNPLKINPLSA